MGVQCSVILFSTWVFWSKYLVIIRHLIDVQTVLHLEKTPKG